jgi:hypothetical protein
LTFPLRIAWMGIEWVIDFLTKGAYSDWKNRVKENVKKWGAAAAKMLSGIPIIGQFFEPYANYTPPAPKTEEPKEKIPFWKKAQLARERMAETKKQNYRHPYYKNQPVKDLSTDSKVLVEDAKKSIKSGQSIEAVQATVGIATLSKLDEINKTIGKSSEESKLTTMATSNNVANTISNAVTNNRVNNVGGGGGNPHFSNAQNRANAVASANIM